MKIEQIQQVIEIAQTGSINKAAQNLYVAQSSLSSSLRALERQLDTELFVRTANGIDCTEFGSFFVEKGKEILDLYQEILDFAQKGEKGISQQFSVSVYYLLFATRAFSKLCNRYKDTRINFSYRERNRMEIITEVAGGVSEIGLLMMPSIRKEQWMALILAHDLEYRKLSDEAPCVLFGEHSELYHNGAEEVSLDFLRSHKMIVLEDQNELFRSIDREIFRKFQPGSYINLCDRGSLMSMLRRTESYFLATTNRSAYEEDGFYADIKSVPVRGAEDFFHFEIGCIKKKGQLLSPLAEEYLKILSSMMQCQNQPLTV